MSLRARETLDEFERPEGSAPRRRDPSLELDLKAELATVALFAGYEVLGRIAVGGMAEVFLARERGEGGSARHVALKVIRAQDASRPEAAAMFLQEGRVALGLAHPNVCHTLKFGMEQGHPFLAMELIVGVTLRELYARARRSGQPLAPTVSAKIASIVAEALHSAHVSRDERGRALGIVHQDVSPQNVMVSYDGTVKLLDFGVASTSKERAVDAGVESSHVTVRGKTAYLSPEQCSGVSVDGRSDVFSLGIVLFEMLTCSRLFARAQSLDSMRAIAAEPLPAWPASIPEGLKHVLDRALAQDRDDRYPTAAAMQEDLERYLADGRTVVTSAKIAKELERLLGADFGRPPAVDTSREGVAWLRSEAETVCEPIPLVKNKRPSRSIGQTIFRTFAAAIVIAGAVLGFHTLRAARVAPTRAPARAAAPAPEPAPAAAAPSGAEPVELALPATEPTPTTETTPVPEPSEPEAAIEAEPEADTVGVTTSARGRSRRHGRGRRSVAPVAPIAPAAPAAAPVAPVAPAEPVAEAAPAPAPPTDFVDDPGY